jgi:hypothetical protein
MNSAVQFTELRSGDLILYSGHHPLHRLQQMRTGCQWAQVGLILRLTEQPFPVVLESTKLSRARDLWTGVVAQGVQLVPFPERLDSFEGVVATRALNPSLPSDLELRLISFAERMHGLPFNDNKWVMFRSFRRRNLPSREVGFFCSELVAEAYQWIGLLPLPPDGLSSNNYIPADFSSSYPGRVLPLRPGFELSDEQLCSGLAKPWGKGHGTALSVFPESHGRRSSARD